MRAFESAIPAGSGTATARGAASRPSVLRLHRQSGDANLGQTLMRLAARAAAEHRARLGDDAGPEVEGSGDAATPSGHGPEVIR